MSKYLCINGEIKSSDQAVLFADNRSFNYADGVFETIRCLNSTPLFFENHFQRLKSALSHLKIDLDKDYTEVYFRRHISRLLQKNRLYKGARIRITVFRNSGGLYTPGQSSASYIIICSPLESEYFSLAANGLRIGIYQDDRKLQSKYSGIKSCNALFYVLAGIWKSENSLDDCLILNQEGKIIEGLSSNIFFVKNNIIYATTTKCGCVEGTMRKNIIKIAEENRIGIKQLNGFSEEQLLDADEIFLSNAIQGITYVSAYKNRRFYRSKASQMVELLNKKILQLGMEEEQQ